MVAVFQYINLQYLDLFRASQFAEMEGRSALAEECLSTSTFTDGLNYYGTFFSSTMVLHTGTKAIFNVFAETKMPLDKWTIIDIVSSLHEHSRLQPD